MTYRWLTDLDAALRAAGVAYTPIMADPYDYTGAPSWATRGRPASTGQFDPVGVLCHHTASSPGTSDRAELNVILWGNGSAPGPISQLFIGRSTTVYLVAAGRANHGGSGKFPGGQCDDMNARLVGIEVANSGMGERWSDALCDTYAAVVAALCDHYGWGVANVYLHATTGPPCGNSKIDPSGPWTLEPSLPGGGAGTWSLDTWRGYVQAHWPGANAPDVIPEPTPEDDDEMTYLLTHRGAAIVVAPSGLRTIGGAELAYLKGKVDACEIANDDEWTMAMNARVVSVRQTD